jgi:hypothetical protein
MCGIDLVIDTLRTRVDMLNGMQYEPFDAMDGSMCLDAMKEIHGLVCDAARTVLREFSEGKVSERGMVPSDVHDMLRGPILRCDLSRTVPDDGFPLSDALSGARVVDLLHMTQYANFVSASCRVGRTLWRYEDWEFCIHRAVPWKLWCVWTWLDRRGTGAFRVYVPGFPAPYMVLLSKSVSNMVWDCNLNGCAMSIDHFPDNVTIIHNRSNWFILDTPVCMAWVAIRIQRAWRRWYSRRNLAARVIQRVWRDAMVNPHTPLGKRRFERDFWLLLSESLM